MSIGNFPAAFESTNLSRDNLSREIGRTLSLHRPELPFGKSQPTTQHPCPWAFGDRERAVQNHKPDSRSKNSHGDNSRVQKFEGFPGPGASHSSEIRIGSGRYRNL